MRPDDLHGACARPVRGVSFLSAGASAPAPAVLRSPGNQAGRPPTPHRACTALRTGAGRCFSPRTDAWLPWARVRRVARSEWGPSGRSIHAVRTRDPLLDPAV